MARLSAWLAPAFLSPAAPFASLTGQPARIEVGGEHLRVGEAVAPILRVVGSPSSQGIEPTAQLTQVALNLVEFIRSASQFGRQGAAAELF